MSSSVWLLWFQDTRCVEWYWGGQQTFKTRSLLLPRFAVLIHMSGTQAKCSLPSSSNGTGVPTVLSFSHSFQSCVFQSSNLSVICLSPFQGQELITRPVRQVKVCVCASVCVKVHRPCLIGLERASLRLSLPLNYLPAITFLSPSCRSALEGTWQMYFHLMLRSDFAPSLRVTSSELFESQVEALFFL